MQKKIWCEKNSVCVKSITKKSGEEADKGENKPIMGDQRSYVRITGTFSPELNERIDEYMEKNHISAKTKFLQDAVQYYLAAQKLSEDEHEAALISREIKNEIQLALEPMEERLKRRDRMIEILLNALWHSQQATNGMSDAEAEEILIRAVNDIARAGKSYSANDILAAAKTEHKYVKAKPMSEARKNELNFFDSPERPPRHKYDVDESETGNNADGNADKS